MVPAPLTPAQLVAPFFGDLSELGDFREVPSDALPAAYHRLLYHGRHMTVALESYHKSDLVLEVLQTRKDDSTYMRNSLLRRRRDGRIVQFGIVRLELTSLPAEARQELEDGAIPMGRVLISHYVLRRVKVAALWEIRPAGELQRIFQTTADEVVFGRTAVIYCDGEAAVDVLEIMPLLDRLPM